MSLEVGNIITAVQKAHGQTYGAVEIAVTLSFICGFIVLGLGLLRLGWLVEFIPTPAVAGFMTGSAITIASQQVPALFGLASLFNTRDSAYLVIIHTLQNLKHSTKDAAFGVVGLFSKCFPMLGITRPLYPPSSTLLPSMAIRVVGQALSKPCPPLLLSLCDAQWLCHHLFDARLLAFDSPSQTR